MSKKITRSFDGKELVLNVGIGGFYTVYKEATGEDLLTCLQSMDVAKTTLFGQGATYAGYVCECRVNKVKPEYTKEQIFEMVFLADDKYGAGLLAEYNSFNSTTSEPGEQNGQLKESVLTS